MKPERFPTTHAILTIYQKENVGLRKLELCYFPRIKKALSSLNTKTTRKDSITSEYSNFILDKLTVVSSFFVYLLDTIEPPYVYV